MSVSGIKIYGQHYEDVDSFKSNLLCVVCFVFFLDSAKPLSSEFKLSSLKTSDGFSWYLVLLTWFLSLHLLSGLDEEMTFSLRRYCEQWAGWVYVALSVGRGHVKPEGARSLPACVLQLWASLASAVAFEHPVAVLSCLVWPPVSNVKSGPTFLSCDEMIFVLSR